MPYLHEYCHSTVFEREGGMEWYQYCLTVTNIKQNCWMLNTGYHWRTLPVGVLFDKEKFTVSGKENWVPTKSQWAKQKLSWPRCGPSKLMLSSPSTSASRPCSLIFLMNKAPFSPKAQPGSHWLSHPTGAYLFSIWGHESFWEPGNWRSFSSRDV